ncbi:MAG: sortase B protein-sorting domain-containing protein, partial [Clostridia bacterium]|nr:sortase B protein-sorting domain-containing protein [Clostridia bacterium]
DDKYTKVTDANMTFAPGTYYVRYQAAGYYNASPFKEVVIKEGGLLRVTIPQTQTGYTIATEDTGLVWNGSTTLSFTLKDGYSKTGAFAVKVNETPIALDANDQYVITNAQENIEITVEGVADITPPTAEIKVKENNWTSFWNDLTFGLFFKETQDVTITTTDKGSGVKSIQYYLSDGELELDEVKAISDWVDYNGTFKIDPNNRYVVYAKVTDNTGNTLYINSDGIVLDNIPPTLEGIENGKTYYGDLTVIKSDEQFYDIKTVTLDGEPMGFAEGTYGLIPADNAEHIVVVEDHAGNKTTYTVTVMKNYTVTYKADGVVVDTLTVGHGKDATPPAVPAKAGYTGKWDHDGKRITSDIVINAVYTENSASAPSDPQSPQTGDNSHMMLWIALLLISGGALITLTVVDRKRRMASKR